jgi:hypothetical protein
LKLMTSRTGGEPADPSKIMTDHRNTSPALRAHDTITAVLAAHCTVSAHRTVKGQPTTVEMKLEVLQVPVSDVDRARDFYREQLGFNVDVDRVVPGGMRVVQLSDGNKWIMQERPAG